MRPDLPWNVAGISTEAREAARAAARREGLSVGEWLTRRIVAGLSDMSDTAPNRSEWTSARSEYRIEPERQRRDSDAMLDRVSRSESETAEVYRRIEDQLRGMARRLDASERSQAESNRVVSKAAVEMNIAAREQAQAFDQLGAHVAHLSERLQQVEGRDPGDGLRDAVKALHQGLSRLADQISQTASQSATQVSALANNLETVAGRIGQARHDSLVATQALESRVATLDERVRTLEAAAQANAGSLDRALEAIESQRRAGTPPDTILRLEDSVRRLEERSIDPSLDRRLAGIERTLADVMDRVEPRQEPDSVEDSLRKIVQRLDSLESTQREAAAEASHSRPTEEVPPAAPAAGAVPPMMSSAAFGALPAFEAPPFAEPPPFAAAPTMTAAAPMAAPPAFAEAMPAFGDALPAFEPPPQVNPSFAPLPGTDPAAAPTVESYLAAARRSARAAAQQEAERPSIGALRWGATTKADSGEKRTRPFVLGLIVLMAIAVIAGAVLMRQTAAPHPATIATATPAASPAKSTPVAVQHAAVDETPVVGTTPAKPVTPPPAKPRPTGLMPSGVAVAKPAQVAPPPAQVAPPPAQQVAARPASNAPLDRLTAAANAGNAKAQLIVGLKYLDGEGVPSNAAEAAKWIARAAEAGEAVAQYRLGKLYETGRGIGTDPVKAVRWYQAAANQGNRKAMHDLAVSYAQGSGVKKDLAEASRWFLRAANLGLIDSQFNLAVLYERGMGVPQNLVDAYKWYAIAAAQGDSESKTRIGVIASQLDNEARAAAQHAADTFRPGQLDARANVAPTIADATRG